jgi:hypothetical protein
MSQKVCVLSPDEHDEWIRTGQRPDCHHHRHVRKVDACEMAHHGVVSPYSEPIAKFVGPHHLVLKASWTWRKKISGPRMMGSTKRHSFGLATMQLVLGG